jgi:hypothetical protein
MDGELMALALQATAREQLDAALYFEAKNQVRRRLAPENSR